MMNDNNQLKIITDEADKYIGKSVFYFLEINSDEPIPIFKFGITTQCNKRVRTHCRKIGIKRVIKIIDCVNSMIMQYVETAFKRHARSIGVITPRFNNTEIIITNNINAYICKVEDMVACELLKLSITNAKISGSDDAEKIIQLMKNNDKKCFMCGKIFISLLEVYHHIDKKTRCHINIGNHNNIKNRAQIESLPQSCTDKKADFPCEKCGAKFAEKKYLLQHQKRKRPCGTVPVMNSVANEVNNNHVCAYCNKTYSNKYNLAKHISKCNMKNAGNAEPLKDEVAEETDALVINTSDELLKNRIQQLEEDQKKNRESIEELKQMIIQLTHAQSTSQTATSTIKGGNNNKISSTVVNIGDIHINHFTNPNIQYYKDAPEVIKQAFKEYNTDLPMALVKTTWYNVNHPENHSVIAHKNGTCQVMGYFGWEPMLIDAAAEEMRKVAIDIAASLISEVVPESRGSVAVLRNSRDVKNELYKQEVSKVRDDIICGSKFIGEKK